MRPLGAIKCLALRCSITSHNYITKSVDMLAGLRGCLRTHLYLCLAMYYHRLATDCCIAYKAFHAVESALVHEWL